MTEDGAFNLGIILFSVNAVCGAESGWMESFQKPIIVASLLKGDVFMWMLKYVQRQLQVNYSAVILLHFVVHSARGEIQPMV